MTDNYNQIICIHPKDFSTDFLKPIGELFEGNYYIIEDNEESHLHILLQIKELIGKCLIVFLGHGSSSGLTSASGNLYSKRTFVDKIIANDIFISHDIFLLCCNSSDFIKQLHTYNSIIGFGNILSSKEEVTIEAEYTGIFRDLTDDDISRYNESYVYAIKATFSLLLKRKITFKQLKDYIEYFINKEIGKILLDKEKSNRLEVSKLYFELRNEMIFKLKL